MSYPPSPTDNTPQQPYAAPPAYAPQGTPTEKPARNTLGLVAMIIAIVGFIFACIPGALIVGWLLLPIAFILGIASAWARGLSIDCGCFGGGGEVGANDTKYPQEIARDVLFAAAGLWLVWRPRTPFSLDARLEPRA